MYLHEHLIVSAPISTVHRDRPLTLTVSDAFFMSLVETACTTVMEYINCTGVHYVSPGADPGEGFNRILSHRASLYENSVAVHIRGQRLYHHVWSQLHLLRAYADLKNSDGKFYIGEEASTSVLVYETLMQAHNWRVECLDSSHGEHGLNFGSATGWNTFDMTTCIRNWPEKFGWDKKFAIAGGFKRIKELILPKDRPGYESRLLAEKAETRRQRELLRSSEDNEDGGE